MRLPRNPHHTVPFTPSSPVCGNNSGNSGPRYRRRLPRCIRGGAVHSESSAHRPALAIRRRGFDAVKIAAEADVLFRAELAHIIDMVADGGDAGLSAFGKEGRIEIHTDPSRRA